MKLLLSQLDFSMRTNIAPVMQTRFTVPVHVLISYRNLGNIVEEYIEKGLKENDLINDDNYVVVKDIEPVRCDDYENCVHGWKFVIKRNDMVVKEGFVLIYMTIHSNEAPWLNPDKEIIEVHEIEVLM